MQRRHFIQRALAILGGVALGSPLWLAVSDERKTVWNQQTTASQNILRALHGLGLQTSLEALEAHILGGAVYSLAQGIIPARIQIAVTEDRFEEALRTLKHPPTVELELWSDRFSCRHIGCENPGSMLFSPLSYLTRFDSGQPLGLFRHQKLSFHVRKRFMEDPSGWLTSGQPQLEISPEAARRLGFGETAKLELLLLAGMEEAHFGMAFGAELEQLRKTLLVQPGGFPAEAQSLLAQLQLNREIASAAFDLSPSAS